MNIEDRDTPSPLVPVKSYDESDGDYIDAY